METLWLVLAVAAMIVYPIVVVRAALRGRQWAKDTLQAMRHLGGDLTTSSAWLALPEEPEAGAEEASRLEA